MEVGTVMSSTARELINGDGTPCAADAILHAYAGDTMIAIALQLCLSGQATTPIASMRASV